MRSGAAFDAGSLQRALTTGRGPPNPGLSPPFSLRVLQQIIKTDGPGRRFGEDFLWALPSTKEGPA